MSTSTSDLGTWHAIRLVAGREIRTRLTSKAFLWTTVALVAAVVVGGVVIGLVSNRTPEPQAVGLVPAASSAAAPLTATADAAGVPVETHDVADAAAGEDLVADGELDLVVTGTSPLTVVVQESVPEPLEAVLASLAQQLALADAVTDLGGDPAEVAVQVAGAAPEVTSLQQTPEVDGAQVAAGYLAGILLFIGLMTAGQIVAQGVVEEKTSRVVELLLATLRPTHLMAGKVLGIGVIGLGQVALVVLAGGGTALAFGLLDSSTLDLGATAAWALIWFVIGFAMYALLLGALSALVSRQEDVGAVIGPVIWLMIVPYMIAISITPWDPDNPLVRWLSFVPFCAPMIMPVRVALGAVETWEILVAVALSLALVPVLVWFAGRVYANAVLHSGGRMKLRDALRGTTTAA
ncbi:ABC transporter permease [Cellulomonas fimi]|uniref:ABC-type Na+ efflux pump, permease component n=1 Tax=Cellulomonas fimi (strain ATCC 484 / DSM 20113 / JCM 1341 / CCUG 24087 / LMG 16345 / NBRC 15513 / NCIMB 8980 / NCTC 7547 / NRS-133) TaxID=590998 RepID=F4H444_CELFA|nr:ABC transporter permease [Cellulomonas fimi]AEE45396.1 ABC-type Na+ efflux pump, permease component [Cellulomonas fimi ATCC 484]NNH06851.1 ABC transporter permease [Cellulomonas fimi]VEH29247.1 ABC-2 family transporter protein [Cellulomonas fimi]